jgi:hypothetical protein
MITSQIYHQLGVDQASTFLNRATVSPISNTPSWRGTSGTPTGPGAYYAAAITCKGTNSFDTGYAPTGDHSALVAFKISENAQINIIGCGNSGGFVFPGGPEIIVSGASGVTSFLGTTGSGGDGYIERGWRVFGYTRTGATITYLIGTGARILQVRTASVASLSSNVLTMCLGGGRYTWSVDPTYDEFSEVAIWSSALSTANLIAQAEEIRLSIIARGLQAE